jgi:hypothetical protein
MVMPSRRGRRYANQCNTPTLLSTENEVHVHDFHATCLHLLGIDHERLTLRHLGRDFRLTDVHGHMVHDIIL